MTDTNEELLLDPDGIPILTDLVLEEQAPSATEQTGDADNSDLSVEELTVLFLNSSVFKQQLDEIANELTRSVRKQVEQALNPILEEAVTLAFEDSTAASQDAVRQQLEKALPNLIARTLQDE